jgi:alkylhydroperoxidase/carboxymuconolactone decarboxylase family protein YurZ
MYTAGGPLDPGSIKEDPMGAMKEFAGLYYREGALDPKTMQLVALAAMAAAGCTS